MKKLFVIFVFFITAVGCSSEGADAGVTASECVRNDLVGQCPPNTMPRLTADSNAVCSQSGSVGVDGVIGSGEAEVNNVCVGSGSCQLVCELITPCSCGLEVVSPTDGIVCSECAAAGNGVCEPGETPETTTDCATECIPNSSRCEEGRLRIWSPTGNWESPQTCVVNQHCETTVGAEVESASCVANICGDGHLADDEECDDGNDVNDDECTNQCTNAGCGDGVVNGIEECDDGVDNSDVAPNACRTDCTSPRCGDGVIDPSNDEACDDGNRENGDTCTSECVSASCGDGIVDGDEQCDDGAANSDENADACRTNCTAARCGDNVIDPGNDESCDNGSSNSRTCMYGDTECTVCSPQCEERAGQTSYCGDNSVDAANGEQCDDGNTVTEVCEYGQMSCSVCTAGCQFANGNTTFCGDGTVQSGDGEECDDFGRNANNAECTSNCKNSVCGDGLRLATITNRAADNFEYCDDGNENDVNDGCDQNCELTEKNEDTTAPNCSSQSGRCRLEGEIFPGTGTCFSGKCFYPNALPLFDGEEGAGRGGLIHGRLSYTSGRQDTDVFSFDQTCGYPALTNDVRGEDCVDDLSTAYYFTIDYETTNASAEPFTAFMDCNGTAVTNTEGICSRNIANFCQANSNLAICNNTPNGKKRAYWCATAGTVGSYRIRLALSAAATIDYELKVVEKVGSSQCMYLTLAPPGGFPGGLPGGG